MEILRILRIRGIRQIHFLDCFEQEVMVEQVVMVYVQAVELGEGLRE